jgi:hypothetical protein
MRWAAVGRSLRVGLLRLAPEPRFRALGKPSGSSSAVGWRKSRDGSSEGQPAAVLTDALQLHLMPTSWRRPLATVCGCSPSRSATQRSPPWAELQRFETGVEPPLLLVQERDKHRARWRRSSGWPPSPWSGWISWIARPRVNTPGRPRRRHVSPPRRGASGAGTGRGRSLSSRGQLPGARRSDCGPVLTLPVAQPVSRRSTYISGFFEFGSMWV